MCHASVAILAEIAPHRYSRVVSRQDDGTRAGAGASRTIRIVATAVFAAARLGFAVDAAFAAKRATVARLTIGGDSRLYLAASRAPLWSSRLWMPRDVPGTYVVVLKAAGSNPRAVVVVQTVLFVAAWTWLASQVAALARQRAIANFAFVATLLVGSAPAVEIWTTVVGTEALAVALFVAALAASLRLLR